MQEFFKGRLMVWYGKLARIRSSSVLDSVKPSYPLEVYSSSPLLAGSCDCAAVAFAEELKPLVGSLYTLLPFLEVGHCVCFLHGGIVVRRDRDDFYRMILLPPLSSRPVYYSASIPSDLLELVGDLDASSSEWELQ